MPCVTLADMSALAAGTRIDSDAMHLVRVDPDDLATVTASVAETISVTADPSPPPRAALPEQIVLGKDRYGR